MKNFKFVGKLLGNFMWICEYFLEKNRNMSANPGWKVSDNFHEKYSRQMDKFPQQRRTLLTKSPDGNFELSEHIRFFVNGKFN